MTLLTNSLAITIESDGTVIAHRDKPSARLHLSYEELASLRTLFSAAAMLVAAADEVDRATMGFAEEEETTNAA